MKLLAAVGDNDAKAWLKQDELNTQLNREEQQAEERVLEYLRSKEPGQGFSDTVLSEMCGLSLVDAARASHRLSERGQVQRYNTTIDERPFGGGQNCIPCTRIAPQGVTTPTGRTVSDPAMQPRADHVPGSVVADLSSIERRFNTRFNDPNPKMIVGTPFPKSGEVTRNGRVYSKECLEKMVGQTMVPVVHRNADGSAVARPDGALETTFGTTHKLPDGSLGLTAPLPSTVKAQIDVAPDGSIGLVPPGQGTGSLLEVPKVEMSMGGSSVPKKPTVKKYRVREGDESMTRLGPVVVAFQYDGSDGAKQLLREWELSSLEEGTDQGDWIAVTDGEEEYAAFSDEGFHATFEPLPQADEAMRHATKRIPNGVPGDGATEGHTVMVVPEASSPAPKPPIPSPKEQARKSFEALEEKALFRMAMPDLQGEIDGLVQIIKTFINAPDPDQERLDELEKFVMRFYRWEQNREGPTTFDDVELNGLISQASDLHRGGPI